MTLKQTWIITTFLLGFLTFSNAQQEPRSSFFWNNYMHTNPAMTGALYKHQANVQWRNQWTKINGAPTTLWANYAMRLDSINSGIGVSYEYNVIGFSKQHTALLSYAYHIPIRKMFLSLGVSIGTQVVHTDFDGFVFPGSQNDPSMAFNKNQVSLQGDFGMALHGERWNTGISVTQFSGYIRTNSGYYYSPTPHLWAFADYSFRLGEQWKLTPRLQVRMDRNNLFGTLALVATWRDRLWFGTTATTGFQFNGVELGPMIGYDIVGKFRLGYTYEFGINTILSQINHNGTHEIILSYQLR